jgi:hypothetical protein
MAVMDLMIHRAFIPHDDPGASLAVVNLVFAEIEIREQPDPHRSSRSR